MPIVFAVYIGITHRFRLAFSHGFPLYNPMTIPRFPPIVSKTEEVETACAAFLLCLGLSIESEASYFCLGESLSQILQSVPVVPA
ncbi:MAG: hypothetical protein ACI9Y1_002210 [Lentisphaeria bacterium]|jgi:hypothetical protein